MQRKFLVAGRHWLIALLLLVSGVASQPVVAHPPRTTLIVLDVAPHQVAVTVHVPLGELELAFGNNVSQDPANSLPRWQAQFGDYLRSHVHPIIDGKPWSVAVLDLQVQKAEQTQTGPFQEVVVQLLLTPPAGTGTRRFTLNYDVILHQVVTHKALVSIGNDWGRGQSATLELSYTPRLARRWSNLPNQLCGGCRVAHQSRRDAKLRARNPIQRDDQSLRSRAD